MTTADYAIMSEQPEQDVTVAMPCPTNDSGAWFDITAEDAAFASAAVNALGPWLKFVAKVECEAISDSPAMESIRRAVAQLRKELAA